MPDTQGLALGPEQNLFVRNQPASRTPCTRIPSLYARARAP